MAKKKNVKKQARGFRALLISRRAGYVAIVILLLGLGVYMYLHNRSIDKQAKQQKADYTVVDKQMQQVMAEITATVGQPAEIHKTYGCGKTAAKFDEGSMTCNIAYSFFYNSISIETAATLTNNMLAVIKSGPGKNAVTFNPPSHSNSQALYHYTTANKALRCDYNYYAQDSESFNNNQTWDFQHKADSAYVGRYVYQCGGVVKKAFYPTKKTN